MIENALLSTSRNKTAHAEVTRALTSIAPRVVLGFNTMKGRNGSESFMAKGMVGDEALEAIGIVSSGKDIHLQLVV